MLRVRSPSIVCMTTASLLNITSRGGLLHKLLATCTVLISDEASQIPEPAFVAIASRFPQARHIVIGDVNQLQSMSVARDRLDLPSSGPEELWSSSWRAVTFPKPPPLRGALVSGTEARERRLVTSRLRLPNPAILLEAAVLALEDVTFEDAKDPRSGSLPGLWASHGLRLLPHDLDSIDRFYRQCLYDVFMKPTINSSSRCRVHHQVLKLRYSHAA
ncbi:unnamed protein product [Heligmosomoides polygyrus]|uniref:AAA_11 domain-containing protein n=1 Tax=Heligmosomoides polygyrus TaxID=6339 RepID=A0A183FZF0_HELPZ|nr:unnamed protein product [Heligmosomoides polygyrus]